MLNALLNGTITKNEMFEIGLIGLVFGMIGIYFLIKSMIEGDNKITTISMFAILYGVLMVGFPPVNKSCANDYAANNKNNLVSVNAVNTNNKKVIMKFKESDNSTKEINARVKEKVTKDKSKHNKYSLKDIKDGYVIYYIAEDVDIPSKPTLEYYNGTKPLANIVKE